MASSSRTGGGPVAGGLVAVGIAYVLRGRSGVSAAQARSGWTGVLVPGRDREVPGVQNSPITLIHAVGTEVPALVAVGWMRRDG